MRNSRNYMVNNHKPQIHFKSNAELIDMKLQI